MLLCSWASGNLESEPEVRTVLFASGTIFSYLQSAFIPIAAFPAFEAPNWRIGSSLYLGFALVAMAMFTGIHFALKWEAKRKSKNLLKEDTVEEQTNANSGIQPTEYLQENFQDKL